MSQLQQGHRVVAIFTPLGDDVLILKSFEGREELGRPFEYRIELISEDFNVKFDDIIGQNVTVRLGTQDGSTRYFNGFVSQFVQAPEAGELATYHMTVVSWIWFLTRTSDCRIFQNMTVPAIIKQVLRDHGFVDFDDALSSTYREWEYCVQYRETDFDFVSRLMEQEGIYYYFEHENGKHTLVLADDSIAHDKVSGYEEVPYFSPNKQIREKEHIHEWVIQRTVQSGAFEVSDFDSLKPKAPVVGRSAVAREHAASELKQFDYAAEFVEPSDGEAYAKIRLQELQSRFETLTGKGDARGLTTGCLFKLMHPAREDQEREYLVTSARYKIHNDLVNQKAPAASGGESPPFYSIEVTALPSEQPFRLRRITPRPTIPGPQTAFVVGKEGEEIWTDKYGRVKVNFHWDRYGKADESSSCWVRVSQNWAGKKWGAMFLPRIGQEVIVEFLEGDPDHPIITGRVYNANAMPPYDLPANKTLSTLKSNSSKNGKGFNEIRFEDKKDDEQLFIHAQKNMDIRVVNDRYETIGTDGEGSQHLVVEKDKCEHVKNKRQEEVDSDHTEKIGNDRNLQVCGKEVKAVDKALSLTVGDDVIEVFKKNQSTQVTNDLYVKADNMVFEAATNITIKVGQTFIAIESGGITISTTGALELESTGPLSANSDAQIEVKAPKAEVSGDASVSIKGGSIQVG